MSEDNRPVFDMDEGTLNGVQLGKLSKKNCSNCYGRGYVVNLASKDMIQPCGCTAKKAMSVKAEVV